MAKFVVEFATAGTPRPPDGRLEAPAFQRNHGAIWSVLGPFLQARRGRCAGTRQRHRPTRNRIRAAVAAADLVAERHLSVASGQHRCLARSCRPRQFARAATHRPHRSRLDLAGRRSGRRHAHRHALHQCAAHLALDVAQNLLAGAGRYLRGDGRLFVYGPFRRNGQHTASSNADFDASLRAENPAWGVRDTADLKAAAQQAGLALVEIAEMPSNNLVLAFARGVRQNSAFARQPDKAP